MRRREFITLLGGAAVAWPLAARAQQPARRIGVLVGAGNDLQGQSWLMGFRRKLQELGWADARDVTARGRAKTPTAAKITTPSQVGSSLGFSRSLVVPVLP